MHLPPRLVAAIGRVVLVLQECGRKTEAEIFLSAVEELDESHIDYVRSTPETPDDTPDGDVQTLSDADRSKRYRERKRHGSVTNGVTRHVTVVTKNVTVRDASKKGSPDLSKREEKRKLSAFRAVSAESENSENCESSHSRANGVTNVTENVTENVTRHVTVRDATRVLKRLQDKLSATWDLHSWLSELQRIACKPEAEFAKVLEGLSAETWIREKPSRANPGHVIKHWGKYLTPEPATRVQIDNTPPPSSYINHEADAQMRRDLNGGGTAYEPPPLDALIAKVGKRVPK